MSTLSQQRKSCCKAPRHIPCAGILLLALTSSVTGTGLPERKLTSAKYQLPAHAYITDTFFSKDGGRIYVIETEDGTKSRAFYLDIMTQKIQDHCPDVIGNTIVSSDAKLFLTIDYSSYGKPENEVIAHEVNSCDKIGAVRSKFARTVYDANARLGFIVWSEDYRTAQPSDNWHGSSVFVSTLSGKTLKRFKGKRFSQDLLLIEDGRKLVHAAEPEFINTYNTSNWKLLLREKYTRARIESYTNNSTGIIEAKIDESVALSPLKQLSDGGAAQRFARDSEGNCYASSGVNSNNQLEIKEICLNRIGFIE